MPLDLIHHTDYIDSCPSYRKTVPPFFAGELEAEVFMDPDGWNLGSKRCFVCLYIAIGNDMENPYQRPETSAWTPSRTDMENPAWRRGYAIGMKEMQDEIISFINANFRRELQREYGSPNYPEM